MQKILMQNEPSTDVKLDAEWIIGQDDPNQTVEITTPMRYDGDITIVNNGALVVRETTFSLNGDLNVWGDGQVKVEHSKFIIIQNYAYEHQAILVQNGRLLFDHVEFESSGHSWSIGLTGDSHYELLNSTVEDGFITTAGFESAVITVDNTKTAGEFLCFGDNETSFTNSDLVLFWIVVPETGRVTTSLPEDSLLVDWSFPDESASDIPYTARIDSCTSVLWGLISRTGSEAEFVDTHFRVAGLYFESPDSLALNNLTNGSMHTDDLIPASDRSLRLKNSKVDTWNVYTAQNATLSLDNCIFGEALAMDSSKISILNSVCDGTGGYIGAMDKSFILLLGSFIKSQVTSRRNSVLVAANCAFMGGELDADEQSAMFLANTSYLAEPEAHNSAAIFEAQLPPIEGVTDSEIPVFGTARLLTGPDSPLEFRGYKVEYRQDGGPWRAMHDRQNQQVVDDLLATWQTNNLESGPYDFRLNLYHNFDDSISIESYGRLALNTLLQSRRELVHFSKLHQNSPNPFNPFTTIEYELEWAGSVNFTVYNSLGQRVFHNAVDKSAGRHSFHIDASFWPAGNYYYELRAPGFVDVKTMTLVK